MSSIAAQVTLQGGDKLPLFTGCDYDGNPTPQRTRYQRKSSVNRSFGGHSGGLMALRTVALGRL